MIIVVAHNRLPRPRRRGHKDGGHGGQATTISSVVNLLNTSMLDVHRPTGVVLT